MKTSRVGLVVMNDGKIVHEEKYETLLLKKK